VAIAAEIVVAVAASAEIAVAVADAVATPIIRTTTKSLLGSFAQDAVVRRRLFVPLKSSVWFS
jgi:GTP cyclohydrolase I